MGVFDNELILPGTITEITSDYSYGYDASLFGTTDSVTIMGTAFNGPVGKAVEIYSPEHAAYIFGGTYDSRTRREATLVAEIQDAWDRGCRTIYAVRLSGKEISKDFQMAVDTKLKLRVSGVFPSNDNKDIYMVYDNALGAAKVKVYKPAKRATIQEKMQGSVDREDSVLITTIDLSNGQGFTPDTRLVELIKVVNDHPYNNVLTLSIVDENGNDATISSKEAQALSIGAMFGGAYFIGRNENKGVATTNIEYVFVNDEGTNKPYSGFEGMVFKSLVLNSDVTASLPIYGADVDALNTKFTGLVAMNKMFDILEVPGKADLIFGKDKIDYEEVEISDFDLYRRLGSGFATAAKAEYKKIDDPSAGIKVKEVPVSDINRTVEIRDGIYSMLESLKSDYRVLANGVVDSTITGKIPRREDFKIARAKTIKLFGDRVIATSKVSATDMTAVKSYRFKLEPIVVGFGQAETIKPMLYTEKTLTRVAVVADAADVAAAVEEKGFKEGTLFLVGVAPAFTLHRYSNGVLTVIENSAANSDLDGKLFLVGDGAFKVDCSGATIAYAAVDDTEFGTNTYVLVESGESVAVYEQAGAPAIFAPVGGLSEIFGDNEDKTLVTTQSEYVVTNDIVIKSSALDYTTLEEFVEILNEDADLSKMFSFVVNDAHTEDKDEYMEDLAIPAAFSDIVEDKVISYDMNLYIPYKTTDTFARHLAQHCTYTSLKTAPTHGVIGVGKLMDVNMSSVAKRVAQIAELNTFFYAKKTNGKDMLDRNNLPYPIGRNISVVLGQYVIALDGYSYISNAASGYAGMISSLPLDQSSTSQPIAIPAPMYELTNFQLEKLTQLGFVTFKQSYTRGFVVTDGITMAPAGSPFRRLSVTRIANSIEELIRAATEPYIGKQNHLANRNSMQTAIKSSLDKIKGKLIEEFEFTLVTDTSATVLGIINIDYVIVPVYEIREVRNRITVKQAV